MKSTELANTEPIELEGERFSGYEHEVFIDNNKGTVSKFPGPYSFFQDMSPEAVESDLDVMNEAGIPMVDTRLYGSQTVSYIEERRGSAEKVRKQVGYLLLQPLISPSHAMSFADLLHVKENRKILLELVLERERIKAELGRGLDLLGGQGFEMVFPALNPRVKSMSGNLGNLLIADDDVQTNDHWAKHAKESNGFVAKKGEVLLCDTRLMPIGRPSREDKKPSTFIRKAMSPILRKNEEFQDAALWATLEGLGTDPNITKADQRFDTGFKRFVRWLTLERAMPKMIAGAENRKQMQ